MHILTGESSLRALRACRYRGFAVALPEPALPHRHAFLPGQEHNDDPEDDAETTFDSKSLATSGFDFARVETNAKVELWRLGDVGAFTKENPLELGVFERSKTRTRLRSRVRMLSRDLPADALVRVDPTLYFVGPELIVLQMASQTSDVELAQIIMELCGSYTPSPVPDDNGKTPCLYKVSPVTTIARIRAYIDRFRQRGGKQVLHSALGMALEGAASPAETNLALAMSLPRSMGGYGLPISSINASVSAPDDERNNVGGDSYALDVFWQDAYADLEYESTEYHLDPLAAASLVAARDERDSADPEVVAWRRERIAKADADRRRMRDLQYLGLLVIPVTNFDLLSVHRMDQVARSLVRRYEQVSTSTMDEWRDALDEKAWRDSRLVLLQKLQPGAKILA